jgi:small-conductance mechanosensitive channel
MDWLLAVAGRSVSLLLLVTRGRTVATFSLLVGRSIFVLAGIFIVFLATLPTGFAQAPASAPQVDISQLTGEERAELLSRLSDEQVRELMMTYMREQAATQIKQTQVIDEIHQEITLFRQRLGERLSHIGELPSVPGFVYARLAEGRGTYHPLLVLGLFIGIALLAFVAERGYRRSAKRFYTGLLLPENTEPLQRLGRLLARLGLDLIGLAVFAATILGMFFLLYQGHEPTRLAVLTLLTALLIVRMISVVSNFFFTPFAFNLRVAPFDDDSALRIHRWIVAATSIAVFGFLACALMLNLGLPSAQHDLLRDIVGFVLALTLIAGAIRLRKPVAAALVAQTEGDDQQYRFLGTLASLWHVAFIAYILFLYILTTYKRTIGEEIASYPGLVSGLIILLVPAADFFLRSLLDYFFPVEKPEGSRKDVHALPVFKRAARILVVILAVFLIGKAWSVSFFALGQETFGEELVRAIVDIALTLLVAYVAWGAIKAGLARYLPAEDGEQAGSGDESGMTNASRLGTIMPLVMRFIQTSLAVIVVMILLSSLGVNIGPLLAGAGVVGIAVGFGAQTLVRDVVSGLFFLMDDAFRKGEYVDIGKVKGTVEGINVRSLVLRHHLGILHTVPYGEIQYLSNFSRDWVIVKMEFRVPTDTDVNKVKKIFKQIGADMLEHPELGNDFLEPFKSQGVKAIEDSAMIVRGKFMSKPGRQFMLRKELYNRVQKAFQEGGIEFAHRKVTVELPPHLKLSADEEKHLAEAAGAAAIGAEEAEKEN